MNKYSRNQTANEAYAVMKTKKPFGKEDHKIVGNRAEAKRVANRENEKLEGEGKENDSRYIYRKVSEDNAEKYNLPKGAKEMVENNKEELYGLEALEMAGLDEFQSALSQALNERGAITVIETMMNQEVGSDFKDQLHFIKNTTDLSDTNLVLNEIMQSVETLLDDVQVDQMVEALKPSEFEMNETEPELGEYEEPENWGEVDQVEEEPQDFEEENPDEDGEAHEAMEAEDNTEAIVNKNNLTKYYNDPNGNLYYKASDMDKYELVDGFDEDDIIMAMNNGVKFKFRKGEAKSSIEAISNGGSIVDRLLALEATESEEDSDFKRDLFLQSTKAVKDKENLRKRNHLNYKNPRYIVTKYGKYLWAVIDNETGVFARKPEYMDTEEGKYGYVGKEATFFTSKDREEAHRYADELNDKVATESTDENELTKLKMKRQQVENALDRKSDQGVDYSSESKELDEIDAKIKELEASDKRAANESTPAIEGSLVERLKALAFEGVLDEEDPENPFDTDEEQELYSDWDETDDPLYGYGEDDVESVEVGEKTIGDFIDEYLPHPVNLYMDGEYVEETEWPEEVFDKVPDKAEWNKGFQELNVYIGG